jgi:hypothetical protein
MSPRPSGGYLDRPAPSGLADVIEIILDKGIVIDAYVRVSLVGIEILTVDARVVIASVDTYLRFAEATNRLELEGKVQTVPGLLTDATEDLVENVAESVVEDKITGAVDKTKDVVAKVVPGIGD